MAVLTSDLELLGALGEIVGLALIPMLLLRFVGSRAAAIAFAVLAVAYLQGSLHLL